MVDRITHANMAYGLGAAYDQNAQKPRDNTAPPPNSVTR